MTVLPVGLPWGFVWLLPGGLVWVQTGRECDPGVGSSCGACLKLGREELRRVLRCLWRGMLPLLSCEGGGAKGVFLSSFGSTSQPGSQGRESLYLFLTHCWYPILFGSLRHLTDMAALVVTLHKDTLLRTNDVVNLQGKGREGEGTRERVDSIYIYI